MQEHQEARFKNVRLINADCLEILRKMSSEYVDMILVDPPYGIDYSSRRTPNTRKANTHISNDKSPFIHFIPLLSRILKSTGCCMVFTRWNVQQSFIDKLNKNGLKVRSIIIWDKKTHGMGDVKRAFASCYESILFCCKDDFRFNGKRPNDIISVKRVAGKKLKHQNQKPVELLSMLIKSCTKENQIILDPCCGSGSTAIACLKTNRKFIGVELDGKYYAMSKQRISNFIQKAGNRSANERP